MTKRWPAALLAAACLLCTAGCRPQPAAAPPGHSAAGQLVVYTSHREEVYGPVIKEFQQRTGIWVQVHTGGTNVLLEQIADENGAPRCDVLFGGGADSHEAYADYFESYESPEAAFLEAAFRSPNNKWTPFSNLPMVIIYNTRIIRAQDAPTSWESLLDPQWKGRIAFADPVVSGSCFTALATMMQVCPGTWQDVGVQFAENLDGVLLSSSSDIIAQVVDGVYPVGITHEEVAFRQHFAGKEVEVVYPAEGTCAVPDATALVAGAPNRENAQLFIDFTISRDIQQMLTTDFGRRAVRKGMETPQGMQPMSAIPLMDFDYAWCGENREEILFRWQREF